MKLIIVVVLVLVVLCGCENEPKKKEQIKTESTPTKEKPLKTNDPIFYSGSSFGNYFQELFKQGLFDQMVEHTDSNSRATLGDSIIKNYYRNIDFSFEMNLHSTISDGNVIWLNYECQIDATKKIFRFPVVICDDSCKLEFRLFKESIINVLN